MNLHLADVDGFPEWQIVVYALAFAFLLTGAFTGLALFHRRLREVRKRVPTEVLSRFGWETPGRSSGRTDFAWMMALLIFEASRSTRFGGNSAHFLALLRAVLFSGFVLGGFLSTLRYAARLIRVFRNVDAAGETNSLLHYARLMLGPTIAGLIGAGALCALTATLLLAGRLP